MRKSALAFESLKEARNILWIIEPHTKIKHQLLKQYIDPWMNILLLNQKRYCYQEELIYFDGFSGPGLYWRDRKKEAKCLGSPLIVANIARKYIKENHKRKIRIICVDKKEENVKTLNYYLGRFNLRYKQYWEAFHGEFDDSLNSLLDIFEEEGLNNPPIFFFIDPFGYTGFPIETLRRVLRYPLIELFINLDVYDIIRFCEDQQKARRMFELFGTGEFKDIGKCKTSEEKYTFIINLYRRQLIKFAGAHFAIPFRVNAPAQGTRARYYLVHASKNFAALKLMKDTMAKTSQSDYKFEAIGIPPQRSLFERSEKMELRGSLESYIRSFAPDYIDYANVEEWAYINSNGISKTIKEELINLAEIKKISIIRKPRQRKNTVTDGAIIKYISK